MPQMAPISWLTLFMVFSITLIIFSMMNYFMAPPSPMKTSTQKKMSNMYMWKW